MWPALSTATSDGKLKATCSSSVSTSPILRTSSRASRGELPHRPPLMLWTTRTPSTVSTFWAAAGTAAASHGRSVMIVRTMRRRDRIMSSSGRRAGYCAMLTLVSWARVMWPSTMTVSPAWTPQPGSLPGRTSAKRSFSRPTSM